MEREIGSASEILETALQAIENMSQKERDKLRERFEGVLDIPLCDFDWSDLKDESEES